MKEEDLTFFKSKLVEIYSDSRIVFKETEIEKMEITDFGLGDFENIGLGIIIYVNTQNVCAKELALLPFQICPQHRHPPIKSYAGKEETFRCRWGQVYLYVEGESKKDFKARIPIIYKDKFTVFNEIILNPGEQYTLFPDKWHWFQGGPKGVVLSEFSTHSYDAADIFFDKNIQRIAVDN